MYKYYSTQRPIGPGTFPQPESNPPLEVINYDERLPVSGEVFRAWGELIYQEPLSKADADAYELRPSRHNRDMREENRPYGTDCGRVGKAAACSG